MRLDINDKYCITSDESQFIVNQIGVAGEKAKAENVGTETIRPIAYFSTLSGCYKFLVNKQIRDSDCKSLKEVVSLVKSLNDEIDLVCNF